MQFFERLKNIRENKGYSQTEVAMKIGVKNNTLSSYESGARRPDYETLAKLADLYEVSIDFLINGLEIKVDGNLYFFDKEGLTEEEIDDIKKHIAYVKWKAKENKNDK